MMHTFQGSACAIHFNRDMSGEVSIVVGSGYKRFQIDVPGSDLLGFYAHLHKPGYILAPNNDFCAESASSDAAGIIRAQITYLAKMQTDDHLGSVEQIISGAMAIGELAVQLCSVEQSVLDGLARRKRMLDSRQND